MNKNTNTTRTVFGTMIQNTQLLGLPYRHVANTTLNEKYDVQAGVVPQNGQIPRLRYFAIGRGGHRNYTGADNAHLSVPVKHQPDDASLYRPLPFVVRNPNNDLDTATRSKYAMRKIETFRGQTYVAYYLKRLELDNVIPRMLHNSVNNGVVTSTPFVPVGRNLNPEPVVIPNPGLSDIIPDSGDYLSSTALVRLSFTQQDVAELIEVARVMYDSDIYAVISEIALVAGVDETVAGPGPGNTSFNYREALCATILSFMGAHFPVGFTNQGFDFSVDVGSTEPLFVATTPP